MATISTKVRVPETAERLAAYLKDAVDVAKPVLTARYEAIQKQKKLDDSESGELTASIVGLDWGIKNAERQLGIPHLPEQTKKIVAQLIEALATDLSSSQQALALVKTRGSNNAGSARAIDGLLGNGDMAGILEAVVTAPRFLATAREPEIQSLVQAVAEVGPKIRVAFKERALATLADSIVTNKTAEAVRDLLRLAKSESTPEAAVAVFGELCAALALVPHRLDTLIGKKRDYMPPKAQTLEIYEALEPTARQRAAEYIVGLSPKNELRVHLEKANEPVFACEQILADLTSNDYSKVVGAIRENGLEILDQRLCYLRESSHLLGPWPLLEQFAGGLPRWDKSFKEFASTWATKQLANKHPKCADSGRDRPLMLNYAAYLDYLRLPPNEKMTWLALAGR